MTSLNVATPPEIPNVHVAAFRFGGGKIVFDRERQTLTCHSRQKQITETAKKIMLLFTSKPCGEVFELATIQHELALSADSVRSHVAKLRDTLTASSTRTDYEPLVTVYGIGYKLAP